MDFVMLAEGKSYLKIDGKCNYYAFNGSEGPSLWWTPIRQGTLSEQELADVLTTLDAQSWSTYPEFSTPAEYNEHAQWDLFELAGVKYGCPQGCLPGSATFRTRQAGQSLVQSLSTRGSPVIATTLEVALLPNDRTFEFAVDWGAIAPPAEYEDDKYAVILSGDPDDMGTFVSAASDPWFAEVAAQHQALGTSGPISINATEGGTPFLLYVRTVVP